MEPGLFRGQWWQERTVGKRYQLVVYKCQSTRLQRMGQALLDREREDVNRRSLDLSMLGQRRVQDWFRYRCTTAELTLWNGQHRQCDCIQQPYPESAKPSVFPTSSSILTSTGLSLLLVLSARYQYTSKQKFHTLTFLGHCMLLSLWCQKILDDSKNPTMTFLVRGGEDRVHNRRWAPICH